MGSRHWKVFLLAIFSNIVVRSWAEESAFEISLEDGVEDIAEAYEGSTAGFRTGPQANGQNGMQEILSMIHSINETLSDLSKTVSSLVRNSGEAHLEVEARLATLEMGNLWLQNLHNVTFGILDEASKQKLLQHPRAKLFMAEDLTGSHLTYNYSGSSYEGGCDDIDWSYSRSVKSVDTEGTCIRLFSQRSCSGSSQAVYPGSSLVVDSKLNGVHSVGPCFSNEFEHATLEASGDFGVQMVKKIEPKYATHKNPPDLIRAFRNFTAVVATVTTKTDGSYWRYFLGYGERLEFVQGHAWRPRFRDFGKPQASNWTAGWGAIVYSATAFNSTNRPNELLLLFNKTTPQLDTDFPPLTKPEGPAEQYTSFMQSKAPVAKYQDLFTTVVKKHETNYPDSSASLSVDFIYESSTAMRPSGALYSMELGGPEPKQVIYGYSAN